MLQLFMNRKGFMTMGKAWIYGILIGLIVGIALMFLAMKGIIPLPFVPSTPLTP